MFGFIGSHFDWLAVGAVVAFMIVLGTTSFGDALRRRREARARSVAPVEAAPRASLESTGQDEWETPRASRAA
jgi:hypothetical protein